MKTRNDAIAFVRSALGSELDNFSTEQIDLIVDECHAFFTMLELPNAYDLTWFETINREASFWRIVKKYS